ncbi:uncharacterized protein LOC123310226 [Coccinella septempunctata]|uniref:uncharacterized protein LOC123310226 n=1 Tax=Coccinella septempunctata TaxID=41139 RepID=UPI001D090BB9|nr:uncharacterized protein LOC123310226 [Coccinella septempunctata]
MDQQNEHLVCHLCGKQFSSVSNKNRHLKKMHNQALGGKKTKHVKCPLCSDEDKISFGSHEHLIDHLEQMHSLEIQQSSHHFENKEDFEAWRSLSNRNVDYILERAVKTNSAQEYIYYNCNRSNTIEYVSQCSQRNMKKGGSIKISGLCPSKISVKINSSGVVVKYIETHVGHNDELRSKRLSNTQQEMLANKLVAGVTKESVLEDARFINEGKLERMNILTRGDLSYIIRKFNINKKRHADDMTATALKVEELNSQDENTESQNTVSIDPSTKRETVLKDTFLKLKSLDDEEFYKMVEIINKTYNSSQAKKTQRVEKRKIEKQLYYPNRK